MGARVVADRGNAPAAVLESWVPAASPVSAPAASPVSARPAPVSAPPISSPPYDDGRYRRSARYADEEEAAPRSRRYADDDAPRGRRRAEPRYDEPSYDERRRYADDDEPPPRRRRRADDDAGVADLMNYATDGDVYVAWAEAVVHGRLSRPLERRYNAGAIFKRAQGAGAITRVEGLKKLLAEYGDSVVLVDLLPVGAQRRDWLATIISDGTIIVRHAELQRVIEMTERFASDLRMYAG
jgi:hypothetical protein